MKDKKNSLDDIRPARGAVKVKNKPKENVNTTSNHAPEVISGTNHMAPDVNNQQPTEEAMDIIKRLGEAKEEFADIMRKYNALLKNKTLGINKSQKDIIEEQKVIENLIKAALKVERYSPQEGLMGLCVLCLRQGLKLRDAGNELAYELKKNKNEPEEKEKNKNKLQEIAKQMGISIKIDEES